MRHFIPQCGKKYELFISNALTGFVADFRVAGGCAVLRACAKGRNA